MVEVSHEALIRGWPRFGGWVEADRAGLRLQRRLTEAAGERESLGRDAGALYRGARLLAAARMGEDHEAELNPRKREFLETSLAAQKAEQEQARRRTRRLRMLAVVLAVFLLAAIAAAALAVDRTLEAERQSETALSRALAGEAPLHVRNELDLASLLAVEAYRVQRTPEARAALTRLVQATARVSAIRVGGYTVATFSPNGETLALGTGGGEIRLWDVRGERFLAHPVDVGFVELLAYSGDGRTLAMVGGRRLILWDAAGPRLEQRTVAPFPVYESGTLAVDRNGGTIAFTSGGRLETALVLWRVGTPRPVTLRPDAGLKPSAEFTRDGRTLVVVDGCCQQAFIRRFRIDAGRVREIPPTRFDRDCCDRTALSPGAEMVVAETNHDTVGVWDVPHGRLLKTYPSTAAGGYGIAIDRARSIAIGDWDGTITRYGLELAGTSPEVLQGRRGSIYQVAFGRSGTFASVDNREGVIVWRLDGTLEAPVSERAATALTATESRAVAALRKRLARAPAFRGLDLDGAVIEVSPRGTTFALNLDAPEIVIGDVRRLIRLHTVRIPGDYGPSSMGYLDDDTLVAGQADVRLWNTDSGEETHVLAHRSGDTVGNLEATPDGETLVVGYDSGDVVAFDVARERARFVRRAHNDFARVAVNRDGRTFASGGREGDVKLWDLASGRELGDPLTVGGEVEALFFDEGRTLAVLSESWKSEDVDRRAWRSILWRPAAALERLCLVAGRNLTVDEWHQFVPDREPAKTCPRWPAPR